MDAAAAGPSMPGMDEPIRETVTGLGNADFLARHARPGMIALAGGSLLIERAIRRAQRHLRADGSASPWSHAFIIGAQREDGRRWVLESDLEIHRGLIRLGVQENRIDKYHDETVFANLALIDVGLDGEGARRVMAAALELMAGQVRYSLRELVGTLLAIRRPGLRSRENLLAREGAFYCSAMVHHCFARVGIDLAAGIATKNVTPEDIAATPAARRTWLLLRSPELPRRRGLLRRR